MAPSHEFYSRKENLADASWKEAQFKDSNYACEVRAGEVTVRGYLDIDSTVLGAGSLRITIEEDRKKKLEEFNRKVFQGEVDAREAWEKVGAKFGERSGDLAFSSSGGSGRSELALFRSTSYSEKWRNVYWITDAQRLRSVAGLAQHICEVTGWSIKPLDKSEVVEE